MLCNFFKFVHCLSQFFKCRRCGHPKLTTLIYYKLITIHCNLQSAYHHFISFQSKGKQKSSQAFKWNYSISLVRQWFYYKRTYFLGSFQIACFIYNYMKSHLDTSFNHFLKNSRTPKSPATPHSREVELNKKANQEPLFILERSNFCKYILR